MTCSQVKAEMLETRKIESIKLYCQRKKVAAQIVINPVENQDESFNTIVVVRALNRLQFLVHRPLITKIDCR